MLNNIPYAIYNSATVVILIGVLVGPVPAAVFTAARTLTNPAISIVSAIDSTDKPRAARALAEQGVAGLRRSVSGTRRLLIGLTGSYLGLVALFADPLIALAFHGRYAGVEHEVQILALAFFLFCLNQPSETLLIVLKASEAMFAVRTAAAVATVIALIAAIPFGVKGMAIGLVAAQALLRFAEHRASARREVLTP
jgi:O-antigen/teichoic acid export membrane protein